MTKTEILEAVLSIVNRSSDATAVTMATLGYRIALENIQRIYPNWSGVDTTDYIDFEEDVSEYDVFDDFKEPIMAYIYDPTEEKPIAFYNKVNIQTLRERRFKTDPNNSNLVLPASYDGYLYAIHDDQFFLYPLIDSSLVAYQFGMDYSALLDETSENNFFTQRAFDYLIYRTCRELVPIFGLSDSLEEKWLSRESEAMKSVLSSNISRNVSGPLRIRG